MTKRHTISLRDDDVEFIKEYGFGNMSLGVRRIIDVFLKVGRKEDKLTSRNVKKRSTKTAHTKNNDLCSSVIDYLNSKASTNFRSVGASCGLIAARHAEGFVLDDFKRVIDVKTEQWLNDPKMRTYLRPETLFNATKFSSYIGETSQENIDDKILSYWDKHEV